MDDSFRDKLKRVRKAIIAGSALALQIVNMTVPDYGDETQFWTGLVIAVLGTVITYQVPNKR